MCGLTGIIEEGGLLGCADWVKALVNYCHRGGFFHIEEGGALKSDNMVPESVIDYWGIW